MDRFLIKTGEHEQIYIFDFLSMKNQDNQSVFIWLDIFRFQFIFSFFLLLFYSPYYLDWFRVLRNIQKPVKIEKNA